MSARNKISSGPARQSVGSPSTCSWKVTKRLAVAMLSLFLAALVSPVSQSSIAPIYGSITSAVNHKEAMFITVTSGFLIYGYITPHSKIDISHFIAIWASFVPLLASILAQFSGMLGPVGGPISLGLTSCHSIVFPCAWMAAKTLEGLQVQNWTGRHAGIVLQAIGGALICSAVERYLAASLPHIMALFPLLNPVTLQLLVASALFLLAPSRWRPVATVGLVQALLISPHGLSLGGISGLNTSLASQNWTILDRAWSTTGYVSVLESTDQHYRVLRCDHSLLGGEWLLTPSRARDEKWKVNEPIYSVFAMLEAVRLLELHPSIPDAEANALVIGLGIGTAPAALIKHGINTTIIELDPVVHKFATSYFALPSNHTAVLSDAIAWVSASAQSHPRPQYDYILHDVFTGGAEPLALFTLDFLTQLRSLLTPHGVIALNYAGDLALPLTRHILHTIAVAFDHQCKAFRDIPPPSTPDASPGFDFLNMVVFCRNSPGPLSFRAPSPRDFLDSKSRKHYLLPRPDHELALPTHDAVLRLGDEHKWAAQQLQSAKRHWHIMRGVLPDRVWEFLNVHGIEYRRYAASLSLSHHSRKSPSSSPSSLASLRFCQPRYFTCLRPKKEKQRNANKSPDWGNPRDPVLGESKKKVTTWRRIVSVFSCCFYQAPSPSEQELPGRKAGKQEEDERRSNVALCFPAFGRKNGDDRILRHNAIFGGGCFFFLIWVISCPLSSEGKGR
nr:putative polyamine aminopropyl transferase [Quercus suber]